MPGNEKKPRFIHALVIDSGERGISTTNDVNEMSANALRSYPEQFPRKRDRQKAAREIIKAARELESQYFPEGVNF